MHWLSGALPHRSSKFICDCLVGAGGRQQGVRGRQAPEPNCTSRRQRDVMRGQAGRFPVPPMRD